MKVSVEDVVWKQRISQFQGPKDFDVTLESESVEEE